MRLPVRLSALATVPMAALLAGSVPFALQAQSLEERMSVLERELESLRLRQATTKSESYQGLGPAASGVYFSDGGLSIGGYGEAKYRNYQSNYESDIADLHRLIFYAGYRFNDWIVLNTEIEIEHTEEIFAEFAYIDFALHPAISLGVGLQLIPSGITNYLHEPTTFYSVNRPQTERSIIPSTWRELGALLHGEPLERYLTYRVGIFSGGRAMDFSGSSWIRGGRQNGGQARSSDLAGIINLETEPFPALRLGLSYYAGDNGQGEILEYSENDGDLPAIDSDSELAARGENRLLDGRVRTHLAEAHFISDFGPFSLRGLFASGWMSADDTRAVNRATGENIGKQVEGGYIEAAFDILALLDNLGLDWSLSGASHRLYLFLRSEYLNTQKETITCRTNVDCVDDNYEVPNTHDPASPYTGNRANGVIESDFDTAAQKGLPDPANDRRILVYGLAYFPHPNVVLKADFEDWSSQSAEEESENPDNNQIDRFNLSVGWIF